MYLSRVKTILWRTLLLFGLMGDLGVLRCMECFWKMGLGCLRVVMKTQRTGSWRRTSFHGIKRQICFILIILQELAFQLALRTIILAVIQTTTYQPMTTLKQSWAGSTQNSQISNKTISTFQASLMLACMLHTCFLVSTITTQNIKMIWIISNPT